MVDRLDCTRWLKHLDKSTVLKLRFVVKNVEVCVYHCLFVSTLERLVYEHLVQSWGSDHHVFAFDSRIEKLFNSFEPLSLKVSEIGFRDTCVRMVKKFLMEFEKFEHSFGRTYL